MLTFKPTDWVGVKGMSAELFKVLQPVAYEKMVQVGAFYSGEIKKTLTGQRHGRVYNLPSQRRRPGRRAKPATYTASAPGEPPAVMFGNLRNSIGFSRPKWNGATIEMQVGVGLGARPRGGRRGGDPNTYARILEWGGIANGVRILPRPYMAPTALRVHAAVERMLARL